MKKFLRFLGALIIILALIAEIFTILYLCLFQGIVGIIDGIQNDCNASMIAFNILKIFPGVPIVTGLTSAIIFAGAYLFNYNKKILEDKNNNHYNR